MTDTTPTNPWDNAPSGVMSPFITEDERNSLILDKTVVQITRIYPMETRHGKKVYADIAIPGVSGARTCSFDAKDQSHPRLALLRYLSQALARDPSKPIPAILVSAGDGYIFDDPRRAT